MEITTIFLALLALMYAVLTFRVSQARGTAGVSIGTGKDENLIKRVRAHGNFAEYAPILLFIMWMIEYNSGGEWFVWLFGIVIVVGRLLHAYGMSSTASPMWARIVGMICTLTPLVVGAIALLYFALT